MKINLIVFGSLKNRELKALSDYYQVRLTTMIRFQLRELKETTSETELESLLQSQEKVILLDEYAKTISSKDFANQLRKESEDGQTITFVIGPAEGFSDEFKKNYQRLSLSPMTFTHEMAQVLLLEQIYRAQMILSGKPYHKA